MKLSDINTKLFTGVNGGVNIRTYLGGSTETIIKKSDCIFENIHLTSDQLNEITRVSNLLTGR